MVGDCDDRYNVFNLIRFVKRIAQRRRFECGIDERQRPKRRIATAVTTYTSHSARMSTRL
jgi:hypothetical protein